MCVNCAQVWMAIVCVLVPVYVHFVHLFMCLNVLHTFVCVFMFYCFLHQTYGPIRIEQ